MIHRNRDIHFLIKNAKVGDRIEGIVLEDIPRLLKELTKRNDTISFSKYRVGDVWCLTIFGNDTVIV